MVECKIYVEGGGDSKALKSECRRGFRQLLEKAGLSGRMPRIVACGSRGKAYDSFHTSIESMNGNQFIVLLIDSEKPIPPNSSGWSFLYEREQWQKPQNADEENLHFMVQCMESWFLADIQTLTHFYGIGFNPNALPRNPNIENIDKIDVQNGIAQASRNSNKGEYHKGNHSYEILGQMDPNAIINRCTYANRLFVSLSNKLT